MYNVSVFIYFYFFFASSLLYYCCSLYRIHKNNQRVASCSYSRTYIIHTHNTRNQVLPTLMDNQLLEMHYFLYLVIIIFASFLLVQVYECMILKENLRSELVRKKLVFNEQFIVHRMVSVGH